jgi:phospholipid transport system transporter-binding protein
MAGSRMTITGPMTVDTAAALVGNDHGMQQGGEWVVDLQGVSTVDSAAVSLLLVWFRRAQHNNAKLVLMNVPDNLLSLAKLYGVAESLNLQ